MNQKYNIYLVSDSTGETLDRIFLSIKSQFSNFVYNKKEYSFVRTEQQILKILSDCQIEKNSIILYTIVETKLAKFISRESEKLNIPCFGILGSLILNFSKLLNQKAIHKPSAQHVLDDDYYKRIEAIQFTMIHDDGKKTDDISQADIVLLGVSRTSKTPTSIYLSNRGFKTVNIPLVLKQEIPDEIKKKDFKPCVIGLYADPERLHDIRRNRVAISNEKGTSSYTNLENITEEVNNSQKLFKQFNWPIIDVTRKSVEETAASIIKIYEIKKNK
ncbi:MAG: pyruvate, water dikinase regulatory protein [Pseudomonadota bacterium]|nr:pyruvate, water dikinase regulatory protein [Pseudomonadota bacterium]